MALPSKELSDAGLDALIARERTRVVAPLTEWHTLSAQLRDEGLVHGATRTPPAASSLTRTQVTPRPRTPWRHAVRWTRNAVVGAALVGGGVVIGRGMTLGDELVPMIRGAISNHDLSSVAVVDSNGTSITVTSLGFKTPLQAQAALARSQAEYQRAAAYLAASDGGAPIGSDPTAYRDRLAALDQMMTATLGALHQAPADPLLNQYYLSTVGAREATLQELTHAPPAGAELVRF